MNNFLGIDTSNYTTSCAVFNPQTAEIFQSKKLLPVKKGELGLRQSDAVFNHVKQLPEVLRGVEDYCENIGAVGVSVKPRWVDGSYMPCFLVGEAVAEGICSVNGCEIFKTSHQTGHVVAALYSCSKLELLKEDKPFIAFHVSGGTTDMLLCKPDKENVLDISEIGHSLDLKAGQLIDRVGVMLGLDFPCGIELERLAVQSDRKFKIKPTVKGLDCCLSGGENLCRKMLENNESKQDVARFALEYVYNALRAMTCKALKEYGSLPLVYAGGVMSDKIITDKLSDEFGGFFAKPEFSCDNAAGVAIFAAVKKGLL